MHNVELLVGFQSNQLTNLIHFINKSGLFKGKENPCTFLCFMLYPELLPQPTSLLTILPCTTVIHWRFTSQ